MAGKNIKELVAYSVVCNLQAEMKNYALGFLWWIIEPTLHLLVLYLVFGVFFQQDRESDFLPFLFCGLVPWFWFNKSISNGLGSVVNGRNIILDTNIPKYFFPTVSILQDTAKELCVFVVLLVVIFMFGHRPGLSWMLLPLVMGLQFLLIAALVYFVSIALPYFRDLKYVISTLLQVVMFGSGTFYDYKTMPAAFQDLFLLNPIALLIDMYRKVLLYDRAILPGDCLYILGFAGAFGIISYFLYRTLDADVPRVLTR